MRIVVDTDSGLAPWRQVRDQITRLIGSAALAPGFQLPPIRQLARDLGLASGTVARAYRELETAGWVCTARGKGTVVAEQPSRPDPGAELRAAAQTFVARANQLGVPRERAIEAVLDEYG